MEWADYYNNMTINQRLNYEYEPDVFEIEEQRNENWNYEGVDKD